MYYDKSQTIRVTAFVARYPAYYLYNAFFLIFILMGLALTIFSIPPTAGNNRLQTSFVLLLSTISFKWVINRSLPAVSYLTYLDKYSIACVVFLASISIWFSLINSFYSSCKYFEILYYEPLI